MERLNTSDDFQSLRDRLSLARSPDVPTLVIPAGTCGQASGANDLIRIAKKELLGRRYADRVRLRITGCHGFCQMEPSVLVEPFRTFYPRVQTRDMGRIVEAAAEGNIVRDLLFREPGADRKIDKQEDVPFFKPQVRTILSGNEKVDPRQIFHYIENGGYSVLAEVLQRGEPSWVLEEVKTSGLRGRGGAGFPTGRKWQMLADQPQSKKKYLICNADEGDPGSYMDRSVLEGNPHSILEGMLIGAVGTGAVQGVVYVRDEYPLAVEHLHIAISQARELGLLGENILGTEFGFDIEIVRGSGAFVCGEETALIASIEGKIGEPRQRPPFPVQKGLFGCPTVINNVETWANIPVIFRLGSRAYSGIGTSGNAGTKIFSLVGKSRYTGLVEVPMGITIREIVYEIGGGPAGKAPIKAVQTGGPSGGCIPHSLFQLPIDYDSLSRAGAIMGSGGMIVMDENNCVVDVAKYFMKFLKSESCGKCFTCRKGTQRMFEILEDVTSGRASPEQLDLLEELAIAVKDTTMCGLGQTAPNPVLSTLRYFRQEFEEHIEKKRCRAFVCKDIVGPPCQAACPLGTEAWHYIARIAKRDFEGAYRVIREANPLPSVCARVCHHPCESHCRAGTTGREPIAVRALKRSVTDQIPPSAFKPVRRKADGIQGKKVAVVGAGPAGLSAAHILSLSGAQVSLIEAEEKPGGMLECAIPAYRLPRGVLREEIESLLDGNVTLQCGRALGRDFTIDGVFQEGYEAVFLAMGAHRSRRLNVTGEDADGVFPAMRFLKDFNLFGRNHARGKVAVIGGGNAAVDAARVAVRQKSVDSVTVLYRRMTNEMPAYKEEIEEAIREGIRIVPMVSPVRVLGEGGRISAIECVRNVPGEFDESGRRRPVPDMESKHRVDADTLIVAIGEEPATDGLSGGGIEVEKDGRLRVNPVTFETGRPGVFAGGDVVTGPNTVVAALAVGKKAAGMIVQFLQGKKPSAPFEPRSSIPRIDPSGDEDSGKEEKARPLVHRIPSARRKFKFDEVEMRLSEGEALRESRRCLRCDLECGENKKKPEKHMLVGSEKA